MQLKIYSTIGVFAFLVLLGGCGDAQSYRRQADRTAYEIIEQKQAEALGEVTDFSVERPSDILRRRLLTEQDLPTSDQASYGTDRLDKIAHWPEQDYPEAVYEGDPNYVVPISRVDETGAVKMTLLEALQIGAKNSFDYQSRKEAVFQAALSLDLERDDFRDTFTGQMDSLLSTNQETLTTGAVNSGELEWERKLKDGTTLSSSIAIDLANLFSPASSSMGLVADGSISIPLLRGSGRHIVAEPLTQAERNVLYALYEFERFKKTFAVNVADQYLGVLQQLDQVVNAEENYKMLIVLSRRAIRYSQAGRMTGIQVDQAKQNELRARNRWISAKQSYDRSLDRFKNLIGLPTDAKITLSRNELANLVEPAYAMMEEFDRQRESDIEVPAADAVAVPVLPDPNQAGPWELAEALAVRTGLVNRLDLRVTVAKVYDAQRDVVVKADALRPELTLLGRASLGESRASVSSASSDNAALRSDEGFYSGLLSLDLGLERTAERNRYRNSYIGLEKAVRSVQELEDDIKLSIRNLLRTLLESRESLRIQSQSVFLAKERVKSTNLFLEAGKAEIRDVLEAQEDLISAQNSLTSAAVGYRIAELQIQRDMGLLKINSEGLWQEYLPEAIPNEKQ